MKREPSSSRAALSSGNVTLLTSCHEQDGPRYVYFPTATTDRVSKTALRDLVRTFFDNSAGAAVAAMVGMYGDTLTDADLDALQAMIEKARAQGDKQ